MNNCPIFYKSLFSSTASKINVDMWDECVATFEDKRYLKGFHLLLDYVNADLRPKYGNQEGTDFKIPHGSIVINITIKDDKLTIFAPFLEANQSTIVPLLRQICSLNFNNMDLAQIDLKGNQLNFEYSCKINELHPLKMYYVLREICSTGDKYDDEYVTQFGAKRLYEPIVSPFPAAKAETAYSTIRKICEDAITFTNYFESKRWFGLAWEMTAVALRQMDYYAQPQGQLRNDLEDAISDMYNKNRSTAERVGEAKTFLQSIVDMDKAKLIENLYEVETFISSKRRSSLQNIQENLAEDFKRAKEGMGSGNYMDVTFNTLFCFYNMYYHNNLQEDVSQLVTNAMEKSSGKPWEESAAVLYGAFSKLMSGDFSSGSKKGGFFSRLFGK